MLSILKAAAPFKRVFADGAKEWRNAGDKILPIYRKEYKSRGMTKTFVKAACLCYIDSGEHFYELSSLGARDELLNMRGSPARSVDVAIGANVATNTVESRVDDTPADYDD